MRSSELGISQSRFTDEKLTQPTLEEILAIPPPKDHIFNGGFELGINGWNLWRTGLPGAYWDLNSSTVYEGQWSLVIYNPGQLEVASQSFIVVSGRQYAFSAYVHRRLGDSQGLSMSILFNPDNPDFAPSEVAGSITFVDGIDPPAYEWTQFQAQFIVPAGMNYARITLAKWGPVDPDTAYYYFDNVQVIG